jgi:integrase/recombinase XerC
MHLRRSVVRLAFRTARDLGLAFIDPTLDLVLPARTSLSARPLTDEEVALCRSAALSSFTESRRPAAWALAEASARTSEISAICAGDIDLLPGVVQIRGGAKTDPRIGILTHWGHRQIERRIRALGSDVAPETPLVGSGRGTAESRQVSACIAISEILIRAGLGSEPDVRPLSVPAWASATAFAAGSSIEEVARMLGVRSLDAAARIIGHDWRAP